MRMHATEFVRSADPKTIPPVVVLAGGESLLVQQSSAVIAERVLGDDSDEAVSRVDGESVAWRDVHDELVTVSMFASHRVVLIERAGEFIKENRSVLEAYVKQPARASVLVLATRSFPGNTNLAKAVGRTGLIVECKELEGAALVQWLRATAKDVHQVGLEREAAALLVTLAGSGLTQLEGELAKLAACCEEARIDVEAVRSLVGGWQVQSTFAMLAALRQGRTEQALVEFRRLFASKEPMPRLMGGVAYVYRRLARATELARQGAKLGDALKTAGVFWKEIDESNRYLRRIGRTEAERFLPRLLAADKGLKGADDGPRLPPDMLVERLLVELAGIT